MMTAAWCVGPFWGTCFMCGLQVLLDVPWSLCEIDFDASVARLFEVDLLTLQPVFRVLRTRQIGRQSEETGPKAMICMHFQPRTSRYATL